MINTSFFNPKITYDANGYPLMPNIASMRTSSGELDPRFMVSAPKLSDYSKWQGLQNQKLSQDALVGMDTARRQGGIASLAQPGGALSSGARGIAALQGMQGAQNSVLGQTLQDTQRRMGVNADLLGKNLDLAKNQSSLGMAASAANQSAVMRDIANRNAYQQAAYNNALQVQQGVEMSGALGAQGKGGGGISGLPDIGAALQATAQLPPVPNLGMASSPALGIQLPTIQVPKSGTDLQKAVGSALGVNVPNVGSAYSPTLGVNVPTTQMPNNTGMVSSPTLGVQLPTAQIPTVSDVGNQIGNQINSAANSLNPLRPFGRFKPASDGTATSIPGISTPNVGMAYSPTLGIYTPTVSTSYNPTLGVNLPNL